MSGEFSPSACAGFLGRPFGASACFRLMPNAVMDLHGRVVKEPGSVLPLRVVERIYELSYEFMEYPEDLAALGVSYYRTCVEGEDSGRTR